MKRVCCPGCGGIVTVDEALAGPHGCPECGKTFRLRAPDPVIDLPADAVVSLPPRKRPIKAVIAVGLLAAVAGAIVAYFWFRTGPSGAFFGAGGEPDLPKLRKAAEQVTGLAFKSDVAVVPCKKAQFGEVLLRESGFDAPYEERLRTALRFWGLTETGNLRDVFVNSATIILAVYSPTERTIYLNIETMPPDASADDPTRLLKWYRDGIIVHELTHALQDQHFDVATKVKLYALNEDLGNAYLSILEGHANFAMYVSMQPQVASDAKLRDALLRKVIGNADAPPGADSAIANLRAADMCRNFGEMLGSMPAMRAPPRTAADFLTRFLLSRYKTGLQVAPLVDLNRVTAEAVARPPIGMLQLTPLSEFWTPPRKPVPLMRLRNPSSILADGWTFVSENSLGPMGWTSLHDTAADEEILADRYALFRNGDRLAGLWYVVPGRAGQPLSHRFNRLPTPRHIFSVGPDLLVVAGLELEPAQAAGRRFLASLALSTSTTFDEALAFYATNAPPPSLDAALRGFERLPPSALPDEFIRVALRFPGNFASLESTQGRRFADALKAQKDGTKLSRAITQLDAAVADRAALGRLWRRLASVQIPRTDAYGLRVSASLGALHQTVTYRMALSEPSPFPEMGTPRSSLETRLDGTLGITWISEDVTLSPRGDAAALRAEVGAALYAACCEALGPSALTHLRAYVEKGLTQRAAVEGEALLEGLQSDDLAKGWTALKEEIRRRGGRIVKSTPIAGWGTGTADKGVRAANGCVFIVSRAGRGSELVFVRLPDAAVAWTTTVNRNDVREIRPAGDAILVIGAKTWTCLDARDGSMRWSIPARGNARTTAAAGDALFAVEKGKLSTIGLGPGSKAEEFDLVEKLGFAATDVKGDDLRLYASATSSEGLRLAAFDPRTLDRLWESTFPRARSTVPGFWPIGDDIFVTSKGAVTKVDARTGATAFGVPLADLNAEPRAVFAGPSILIVEAERGLSALNPVDGALLWDMRGNDSRDHCIAVTDDAAIVWFSQTLSARDAAGKVLWSAIDKSSEAVPATPFTWATAGGLTLARGHAFDRAGLLRWRYPRSMSLLRANPEGALLLDPRGILHTVSLGD